MEKSKKIKITLGLVYLIIVSSFLFFFFTKFSIEEIKSYQFIQSNREYFFNLKEVNLIYTTLIFFFLSIIWVLLLGFGSPVALIGGFVFGKWLGTFVVVLSLSFGATFLYLFGSFFFKDLIKEKFLQKFKNLEYRFKKNEFMFFFLYRFVGGIPFQIANLLPVLFNVSIKNYFLGTFLGITPQIFIYVALGSGIEKVIRENNTAPSIKNLFFSPEIYIPILGFLILVTITILVRKIFYKS